MIVQQQLRHDAPFAWYLRNNSSTSPNFRYTHLTELDVRLDSYLICCQESNDKDEQILLSKFNLQDWGAVFIIALIALRSNDLASLTSVISSLEEETQVKELSDALCRVDLQTAQPYIDKLLIHENYLARITGITVAGFFNRDINEELLQQYLNDESAVIVATLKIIGKNKIHICNDIVQTLLTHKNGAVRFQAAYTGCLLGFETALIVLKEFCFDETPNLKIAISLLYNVVNASEMSDAVTQIQKSTFSPRIKAYNIAMAGLPDNIPILMEWLKDPEYAPIAGEAFSFITGVDIEEDDLSIIDVELCESQEAPLAQKRKKDRWTEGYEEDLPWPDPDLVSMWWRANQHNFQNGTRYLAGKTLTEDNLQTILKDGTQTQRIAASLILATQNSDVTIKDVTGYQQ